MVNRRHLDPVLFFPIEGMSWSDFRDDPALRGADDGEPGRGGWRYPRGGQHLHRGIDLRAPIGRPVIALEAGTAEYVAAATSTGWHPAGNRVRLRGLGGDAYLYLHLGTAHGRTDDAFPAGVRDGDVVEVAAGQVIGYVGHTGGSVATGSPIPARAAHLHFEFRPGGPDREDVNPARLFERIADGLPVR
ncbi:MAG: M23 family metallopeptidase [Streptomycetaceae bacterium]|nr:M23 family metallopeptidase [Streptomycetaceae bacterium]